MLFFHEELVIVFGTLGPLRYSSLGVVTTLPVDRHFVATLPIVVKGITRNRLLEALRLSWIPIPASSRRVLMGIATYHIRPQEHSGLLPRDAGPWNPILIKASFTFFCCQTLSKIMGIDSRASLILSAIQKQSKETNVGSYIQGSRSKSGIPDRNQNSHPKTATVQISPSLPSLCLRLTPATYVSKG
ncbi:hypothetical protein LX32DRAFT_254875 [Colletotrichum zoysiae]|uniref:Uncharacterized protein n=1 Tax=Colletotrichum zoysiae TaxID=1216348 RepID=A0AAD9HW84_9PEZI|nr:hypothetical protein LX32DRAFT_254875 [Colletotrichum zoysiae]